MRGIRWDTLYIGVTFTFYKTNTSIMFDFYLANCVFSKIPLGGWMHFESGKKVTSLPHSHSIMRKASTS
jgi:urease beta subunit